MSNLKENIVKTVIILLGGSLLYYAFKPSPSGKQPAAAAANNNVSTTAFDSKVTKDTPEPTEENANIVADAYNAAMQNGEPPAKLTELNQECMKDFGMRAYVKDNALYVCDVSGNTVLTRH